MGCSLSSPSLSTVLGHLAWESEEVDQTRVVSSKAKFMRDSEIIVQSSPKGRGPERVTIGVTKSRGFNDIVGGLS